MIAKMVMKNGKSPLYGIIANMVENFHYIGIFGFAIILY